MSNRYDVILVGAGPAGSTAAMRIAKKGYKTLLIEKSEFPRDKSCGDGLTRTSTKLLNELELLKHFSKFQKIKGVNIHVDNEGSRNFEYPDYLEEPNYGMVVPRLYLDNILCQKAIEDGVVFKDKTAFEKLLYDDKNKKVIGIKVSNGQEYFSDIVIGADGATSKIAYQSSITSTPTNKLGFGIRGYFKNIENLNDKLEIYLPILGNSYKRVLPSYGWVSPRNNNEANIGVCLMQEIGKDNIQTIMDRFIAKLRRTDPRFEKMELSGNYLEAAMRFDFNPQNTFSPGLLLVGDATGLINPFIGEGIGYALETGIIAADFYLELKEKNENDFMELSRYGDILASKYQGYFETGINSVNRYHLVWKVLKSTFQNDKPLFNILRQATIFPEGIGESFFAHYTEDISKHIKSFNAEIRTDILAISQSIINTTRKDWPFLSRLFSDAQVTPGIPFRPSSFLLLTGLTSNTNRDVLIKLGTAIELGVISSLCHGSIIEGDRDSSNESVNWGNMLSILIGDFLLSKSLEIIAELKKVYTGIISKAISTSNHGIVLLKNKVENDFENLTIKDYLELSYLKNKYTFELCMDIGGLVRNSKRTERETLKKFGKHFGMAYFIIEDTIDYIKSKTLNPSASPLFRENEEISLINLLLKKNKKEFPNEKRNIRSCLDIAKKEMDKALADIDNIEDLRLKETLINITKYVLQKTKII